MATHAKELEREFAAVKAENERLHEAALTFRDAVLNQRGALAENGMSNDQVNDVLGEFDDAMGY